MSVCDIYDIDCNQTKASDTLIGRRQMSPERDPEGIGVYRR